MQAVGLVDVGARQVEWCSDGPVNGPVVVYFHGTPTGLRLSGLVGAALLRAGARVVGIARPGYGSSTRQPGRRVVDVADDVSAVLDALGISSFRALGWSGGGPHALAAAARVPGCTLAVIVAGLAPLEGFDWTAGMAQLNVDEFGLALEGESGLRSALDPVAPMMTTMKPEAMLARMEDFLSSADVAAFRRDGNAEAEVFLDGVRAAMAHGNDGWVDDDLAIASDWGFDLGSVSVPVTILHGDLDRMVPIGHGRRLASLLPNATLPALPADGHISAFLDHADEIAAALLPR